MPRLSIVIPCIQEAGFFDTTLASVLQNRPDDCEVLVVQPRVYSDPYELKGEVQFIEAPVNSSLIDLINIGVARATGEIVHLISCEVEILDGWAQPALRHFQDPTVGCVSPLVVAKRVSGQVVSRGVHYSSGGVREIHRTASTRRRSGAQFVIAPTLSAGMYRRQAILDAGGFCADVGTDFADVDLGLLLRAAGYRCVHEEDSIVTTDRISGGARLSFANGRAAERLFWRNAVHANRVHVLVTHPLTWIVECVRNLHRPQIIAHMIGRFQGWQERGSHRGHDRHLRALEASQDLGRQTVLPPDSTSGSKSGSAVNSRAAA